jgi:CBS domain-containing protein
MLLFVAFFVYAGAGEEAGAVQAELLFEGVPVRDAMMTQFAVLAPGDPLARAVELLLGGTQHDFPVVEADRVVGVLSRTALINALSVGGPEAAVSTVMAPAPEGVAPAESLRTAYQRMDDEQIASLPVLDCERLLGLLTSENLTEYVMVRTALASAKRPSGG